MTRDLTVIRTVAHSNGTCSYSSYFLLSKSQGTYHALLNIICLDLQRDSLQALNVSLHYLCDCQFPFFSYLLWELVYQGDAWRGAQEPTTFKSWGATSFQSLPKPLQASKYKILDLYLQLFSELLSVSWFHCLLIITVLLLIIVLLTYVLNLLQNADGMIQAFCRKFKMVKLTKKRKSSKKPTKTTN